MRANWKTDFTVLTSPDKVGCTPRAGDLMLVLQPNSVSSNCPYANQKSRSIADINEFRREANVPRESFVRFLYPLSDLGIPSSDVSPYMSCT